MAKKSRTILFIFLLLVFVIIGPSIIMYSQGYRFDLNKMKFLETGGIYVKTNPGDASISIDSKYQNKTSGFSRDLLIQNLLPQNHKIKIEKEGYYSWEKTLEVKEKMVSEAKYVILFQKEIPFQIIEEDIKSFYPLPDGSNFLLLTVSNELHLYDADTKESKKLFNNKQTPYYISDIVFSPTGKRAYVVTETGLHYLLNLDNTTISLIKTFSSKTKNIFFKPNDEGSFYYQSKNYIFEVNFDKKTDPKLFKKEEVSAFTLVNDSIYSLEKGSVIRTNVLLNTSEIVSEEPFDTDSKSQYKLVSMENEIFLIENEKTIYLFKDKKFEKLLEAENKLAYTPYYDRILFKKDNELYLLLLKDTETPFFKKAYSLIFISKFSENLGDVKWLNGDYFVYALNNKLNISEIDNRDEINSFPMNQDASKIFFNGNTKKLFILNQNEFMVSENKVMP
jgi:WD40 repeat protein